jgi:hypothetical protein
MPHTVHPLEISSYKAPSTKPTQRMEAMNNRGCEDVFASFSCCGGTGIGMGDDMRMTPPIVMQKIHFENTTLPR